MARPGKPRRSKRAPDPPSKGAAPNEIPAGTRRSHVLLSACLILAAGAVAYANSFSGVFILDDYAHIVLQEKIRHIVPLADHLTQRRPLVSLSLALNYHFADPKTPDNLSPQDFHAFNLVMHLFAALALFGVVRRTLLLPRFSAEYRRASLGLSLAIALIWVAHPLQTQSVTYVVQRGESMMGLFYLLTLYCVIRGAGSQRSHYWIAAAVAACTLGMASKAVMVTAPAVIFLYDRLFLSRSFADAIRRRWPLYLGLAGTWLILFPTGVVRGVLNPPPGASPTVGFGYQGVTPLAYLATQPGVVLHYLRLSFWPQGLCLDYQWPVAKTLGEITLPAVPLVALMLASLVAFWRRPAFGFLGAWFFLILLPTSSFIPIKDLAFEHRMYLPLAAVVAGGVLFTYHFLVRIAGSRRTGNGSLWSAGATGSLLPVPARADEPPVAPRVNHYRQTGRTLYRTVPVGLLSVTVAALMIATYSRNGVYQDAVDVWSDVTNKRPDNARANVSLGIALSRAGRLDEAIDAYRRASEIEPSLLRAYSNLGKALAKQASAAKQASSKQRLYEQAIEAYREAAARGSNTIEMRHSLAFALGEIGQNAEAAEGYRRVLEMNPDYPNTRYNLASTLMKLGRFDAACTEFRQHLANYPRDVGAQFSLAHALARQNKLEEAAAAYRRTLRLNPRFERVHFYLGNVLQALGRLDEAIDVYRAGLAINPRDEPVLQALNDALSRASSPGISP